MGSLVHCLFSQFEKFLTVLWSFFLSFFCAYLRENEFDEKIARLWEKNSDTNFSVIFYFPSPFSLITLASPSNLNLISPRLLSRFDELTWPKRNTTFWSQLNALPSFILRNLIFLVAVLASKIWVRKSARASWRSHRPAMCARCCAGNYPWWLWKRRRRAAWKWTKVKHPQVISSLLADG